MATTSYGTPYVQSSDLVSGWPNASLNVADRIDQVSYAGNGINAQTGTSYTLAVTDAGKLVTLNNAAAVAVSLPQDSTANLPVGSVTRIYNLGAGVVTVQAGAGATLQGGSVTVAQYDACDVTKLSANTYGIAAKAPLASPTFTGNVVWSGATLRAGTSSVATMQTTTSTAYTDLASAGPAVTVTTGTKALVIVSAEIYGSQTSYLSFMGFAISGATTVAASDSQALRTITPTRVQASSAFLVTGLTAGSNTFTAKYRSEAGTNTAYFADRAIVVLDLGS